MRAYFKILTMLMMAMLATACSDDDSGDDSAVASLLNNKVSKKRSDNADSGSNSDSHADSASFSGSGSGSGAGSGNFADGDSSSESGGSVVDDDSSSGPVDSDDDTVVVDEDPCSATRDLDPAKANAPGVYANGSEEQPHVICNEAQFAQIARHPGHWTHQFLLGRDLDFANPHDSEGLLAGLELSTIGNTDGNGKILRYFSGEFDGGGHRLQNFSLVNANKDCVSPFGCLKEATIKNISVHVSQLRGRDYVGVLSYAENVHFENVNFSYSLQNNLVGRDYVGFVGHLIDSDLKFSIPNLDDFVVNGRNFVGSYFGRAEFSDSYVIENLKLSGVSVIAQDYAGGLCGHATNLRLTNVDFNGVVSGNNYVGGLVGSLRDGGLLQKISVSAGQVDGNFLVGGLFGIVRNASLEDSFSAANVNGVVQTGGLVGNIAGNNAAHVLTLERVYSSGNMQCGGQRCAGLVGNGAYLNIKNTFFSGAIDYQSVATNTRHKYIAGICGNCRSSRIENTFSVASINGRNAAKLGGIVGDSFSSEGVPLVIQDSFSTGIISHSAGDHVFVGGIIGEQNGRTELRRVYSAARIQNTDSRLMGVGGLMGNCRLQSSVEDSYFLGEIQSVSMGFWGAAGIVGTSTSGASFNSECDIRRSYNKGRINGGMTAGILGASNTLHAEVNDSFNLGEVNNVAINGIVCRQASLLQNVHSNASGNEDFDNLLHPVYNRADSLWEFYDGHSSVLAGDLPWIKPGDISVSDGGPYDSHERFAPNSPMLRCPNDWEFVPHGDVSLWGLGSRVRTDGRVSCANTWYANQL